MTHKRALQMRGVLNYLFTLGIVQYHYVAIRKSYPNNPNSDWEVCLYAGRNHSTSLLELGTLATALDIIVPEFQVSAGVYDAGITSNDIRTCFIIH